MVAFNFMSQFADDVASFRKPGSIRKTKKCKPGQTIQLYTGQRTKDCRKLGEAICTGVCQIRITDDCPWSMSDVDGHIFTQDGIGTHARRFHELEGFQNAADFVDFFRQKYGLPFVGYYHQWQPMDEDLI